MTNEFFGFIDGDLESILEIIIAYKNIEHALIFGSRAKGNFKRGSDVDIAIFTSDTELASSIAFKLNEETLMPYKFDVLDYYTLKNKELIQHIDRKGINIFVKINNSAGI